VKAKNTPPHASMKVRADCGSLTSRAGTALLVGVADRVGLTAALKGVLSDLRMRRGQHEPGQVLRNLGVMPAKGGDALCDLGALRDQEVLFGAVPSDATAWRFISCLDEEHLAKVREAWVAAFDSKGGDRDGAWVAELALDLTATGWPSGTRAICRRERPLPGAQLPSPTKTATASRSSSPTRRARASACLRASAVSGSSPGSDPAGENPGLPSDAEAWMLLETGGSDTLMWILWGLMKD